MFDNMEANLVTASDDDISSAFGDDEGKGAKKKTEKTDGKKTTVETGKGTEKTTKKITPTSKEKPVLGSPHKEGTISEFSEAKEE